MIRPSLTIQRQLDPADRRQVARILYHGFGRQMHRLELFTQDEAQVMRLLLDSLHPEHGLYAYRRRKLVGLVGLHLGRLPLRYWSAAALRQEFGPLGALPRLACQWALHQFDHPPNDALKVDALAVAPDARRQGVGTRLLQETLRLAAAQGYGQVTLNVVDTNRAARALYRRMGFRVTRRIRWGPLSRVVGVNQSLTMARPVPRV